MPNRESYSHGTPCWVDLTSDDLHEAQKFYRAFFGWDFVEETFGGATSYSMAMVAGRRVAGLMQQSDEQIAQAVPAAWNTYIAVDDLSAVVAAVEPLGGQLLMPPVELASQGSMAAIADPNGILVGLWQGDTHVGAGLVNEPSSLIWNELICDDVVAAKSFYTALFGWGVQDLEMPGGYESAGPYSLFQVDGDAVAGMVDVGMRHGENHWASYISVADIRDMQDMAGDLNCLVDEASDIGLGLVAACEDPQGAHFYLMQPAAPSR